VPAVVWGLAWLCCLGLAGVPRARAADPQVPAKAAAVLRVGFVPPPLEGTVSLGVYDKSGKLVRTLRAEAQVGDFTVALNGFVVSWDGKDDSGKSVPAGRYRFSGYAVGDLAVTGEAYHGNDWVSGEDAPHLRTLERLEFRKKEESVFLEVLGTDVEGNAWRVMYPRQAGAEREFGEAQFEKLDRMPEGGKGPVSCAVRGGGRWSVEKVLGETLVVQFDSQGEVVRRLNIGAGEPVPVAVAASEDGDEVFLLEQSAGGERVRLRGLRRRSVGEAAGTDAGARSENRPVWETFFERNRWPSGRFDLAKALLGRPKPFVPEKKIRIQTQPNPLLSDATSPVELTVTTNAEGSYLATIDGLMLRKITDTPRLLWAVIGSEAKGTEFTLFQSDGTVVEEYRIAQPATMMSFDAGEYNWPPK
jgi:hypothetical protein